MTCKSKASLLARKRYLAEKSGGTQDVDRDLSLLSEAREKYGDIVLHHKMQIDNDTAKLLTDLTESGATPLVVGGAVRDSLSTGEQPKDIDIEVHDVTNVNQLIRNLRRSGYRIDEVGRSFGVLKTTLPNGVDVDISLPRRDSLVGEGHRGFEVQVDPSLNVYDAAARRDFTINAMYYDHDKHVVVDPHGGAEDLKNGVLRHVSDAYSEDPLRVLRGVQIASRFNLRMAEETIAASRNIKSRYAELSNERVQEEWHKFLIKGKGNLKAGLDVLAQTEWDEHLDLADIDRQGTAQRAEDVLRFADRRKEDSEVFGTASFALELPANRRDAFVNNVLVGSRRQRMARSLASIGIPPDLSSRKEVKRWARKIGKLGVSVKQWETLYAKRSSTQDEDYITRVRDIARKNGCYESPHPDWVTGEMVLTHTGNTRGGPWVGQILARAKSAQDEEVFMDEAGAREWLINDLNSSRIVD